MSALHVPSILSAGSMKLAAAEPAAKLQMTSLVDMMVILVVFLLMSFSVEGRLVTPADGLQLPSSTSQSSLSPGLVVEIGLEKILVAGRDILLSTALLNDDPEGIALMTEALSAAAAASEETKILVQADRRLEFSSLSQALRACSAAGWSDVSLVVLGGGS